MKVWFWEGDHNPYPVHSHQVQVMRKCPVHSTLVFEVHNCRACDPDDDPVEVHFRNIKYKVHVNQVDYVMVDAGSCVIAEEGFTPSSDFTVRCSEFCDAWIERETLETAFQIKDRFPEAMEAEFGCPASDCSMELSLWFLLTHLNDTHKWTRESIADWLDRVSDDFGLDLAFPVPDEFASDQGPV